MMRLCAWLMSVLVPCLAAAQPFPALYDVTGVDSDDVLNVRGDSGPGAPVTGELAHDAKRVEVTGLDISGRWGRINQGENAGWVAMRFLARVEGPVWHAGQSPLYCFGTEPFWSLTIDPAAKQIVFRDIDSGPVAFPMTQLLTAADGFPAELHARSGTGLLRWASLRAKLCSDGMSDRLYGITASVALSRAGYDPLVSSGTLSGCCSLTR